MPLIIEDKCLQDGHILVHLVAFFTINPLETRSPFCWKLCNANLNLQPYSNLGEDKLVMPNAFEMIKLVRANRQSWHQINLLHELWPKNDDTAKLRYIQKATKSVAYDEDPKACKKRLDRLAISTADFYGENHHLHNLSQKQIPMIVMFVRLQVFYKISN
jgi:hypothetical protein